MANKKILVDTGVVSRYFKNENGVVNVVKKYDFNDINISIISYIELNKWLDGYSLPKADKLFIKKEIDKINLIHLDKNISISAKRLSNANTNISPPDLLIYCTAKYHKLQLITENKKDFKLKTK